MRYLAGVGVAALFIGAGMWFRSTQPEAVLPVSGRPEQGTVLEILPSGNLVTPEEIATSATPPRTHSEEYRNERYGFRYQHTPQAYISEYDEGGGAVTIVHENFERSRGMQIFIVPYTQKEISEERFRADVPSGVRENVSATTLDGVEAVTFTSYDLRLGKTREIWVIKDGYLYEITTFAEVGNWFEPLIQSWRWL